MVSGAMMDLPGFSSINGTGRSSTLDGSMSFDFTQVVQNLSINTAMMNHCAEQSGSSPEDARRVVLQGLNEYMEKQSGLDDESNLQLLAGLQQSWIEPGVLKIGGVFNTETGEYERFDPVTFNGTVVDTSRVINQVTPTRLETPTSQKENVGTADGKKKKSTGTQWRWVARPVSDLRIYIDRKVRITSAAGKVKIGRLSKVDGARYSVMQRIGSGEYGSYSPIEKIKKLELWEYK
jgi:hypothetical protein